MALTVTYATDCACGATPRIAFRATRARINEANSAGKWLRCRCGRIVHADRIHANAPDV